MVTLTTVTLSLSERSQRCPPGDCTVLTVAGCLDAETAPTLRERLIDLLHDGRRHLILDLELVLTR